MVNFMLRSVMDRSINLPLHLEDLIAEQDEETTVHNCLILIAELVRHNRLLSGLG